MPLGPRQRLQALSLPTPRDGRNDFLLTNAAGSRFIAAWAHRIRRFSFAQPPKSARRAYRGPSDGYWNGSLGRPASTQGWAQVGDPLQDAGEQLSCDGDFRQLEHDVLRVRHNIRPDLDQLLTQGRQFPSPRASSSS